MSRNGSWHDWLMYFFNSVAVQSEDALSQSERINSLLNSWKSKVSQEASKLPVAIVEHFAVNLYLTINKISQELNIAYSTAQRGVSKLEQENIIQQVSGNKRDKVYCAKEILAILEEPAKIHADPHNN